MTALPTRKLEAWRYTDLRPLAALNFSTALAAAAPANLPDLGLPRLIFINGTFQPALSATVNFTLPFAAPATNADLPLVAINAEHAHGGITLAIPPGIDAGTIHLISHANPAAPAALHSRHRITLGEGAKLTLIEQAAGQGSYWHNPVFEIAIDAHAALTHYRLQDESDQAFHTATVRVAIAAGAAYDNFTAMLGGRLARAEFHIHLNGQNARAHLAAAQLLRGRQLGDFTSVITHAAPHCASRQTIKSVLADTARGVFQGRIEVDRPAQKTDGYQMSQTLLLSPGAEMDVKPELQIFADDVKCSHGATMGALDPEQIFYLRSRGIPEPEAKALLIRAFLTDALDAVAYPTAHALFETAIANWWNP